MQYTVVTCTIHYSTVAPIIRLGPRVNVRRAASRCARLFGPTLVSPVFLQRAAQPHPRRAATRRLSSLYIRAVQFSYRTSYHITSQESEHKAEQSTEQSKAMT